MTLPAHCPDPLFQALSQMDRPVLERLAHQGIDWTAAGHRTDALVAWVDAQMDGQASLMALQTHGVDPVGYAMVALYELGWGPAVAHTPLLLRQTARDTLTWVLEQAAPVLERTHLPLCALDGRPLHPADLPWAHAQTWVPFLVQHGVGLHANEHRHASTVLAHTLIDWYQNEHKATEPHEAWVAALLAMQADPNATLLMGPYALPTGEREAHAWSPLDRAVVWLMQHFPSQGGVVLDERIRAGNVVERLLRAGAHPHTATTTYRLAEPTSEQPLLEGAVVHERILPRQRLEQRIDTLVRREQKYQRPLGEKEQYECDQLYAWSSQLMAKEIELDLNDALGDTPIAPLPRPLRLRM